MKFTDPKLYLKGTAEAFLQDSSNNVVYHSDKFQTANIATSVTTGEIRGGIGNPVLMTLPTDANMNVTFAAADFSLRTKAAQLGADLAYGAPVLVCQTVTASGEALSVSVADGVPVAPAGSSDIYCFVQEVGAASPILTGGVAYAISAAGAITGFTATSGKQYKVWYWINRANAQIAAISSLFDPAVYRFTAIMAVYATNGGASNEGTHVGNLTVIIPRLKLGGDAGGVTGDQTTPDTTSITGMALAADETVIGAECDNCAAGGTPLAYYIYAPCDTESGIEGIIGVLGGVISVAAGGTYQMQPKAVVNGELANITPADCTYTVASAGVATVSAGGLITGGSSAGSTEITTSYVVGGSTYTSVDNIDVTAT